MRAALLQWPSSPGHFPDMRRVRPCSYDSKKAEDLQHSSCLPTFLYHIYTFQFSRGVVNSLTIRCVLPRAVRIVYHYKCYWSTVLIFAIWGVAPILLGNSKLEIRKANVKPYLNQPIQFGSSLIFMSSDNCFLLPGSLASPSKTVFSFVIVCEETQNVKWNPWISKVRQRSSHLEMVTYIAFL